MITDTLMWRSYAISYYMTLMRDIEILKIKFYHPFRKLRICGWIFFRNPSWKTSIVSWTLVRSRTCLTRRSGTESGWTSNRPPLRRTFQTPRSLCTSSSSTGSGRTSMWCSPWVQRAENSASAVVWTLPS